MKFIKKIARVFFTLIILIVGVLSNVIPGFAQTYIMENLFYGDVSILMKMVLLC